MAEIQQAEGGGPEGRAHPGTAGSKSIAMGEDFTEGFPKGVAPRLRHQGVMKPQQRLLQKEQRLGGKKKQNE